LVKLVLITDQRRLQSLGIQVCRHKELIILTSDSPWVSGSVSTEVAPGPGSSGARRPPHSGRPG
jgi:hypothetical protein